MVTFKTFAITFFFLWRISSGYCSGIVVASDDQGNVYAINLTSHLNPTPAVHIFSPSEMEVNTQSASWNSSSRILSAILQGPHDRNMEQSLLQLYVSTTLQATQLSLTQLVHEGAANFSISFIFNWGENILYLGSQEEEEDIELGYIRDHDTLVPVFNFPSGMRGIVGSSYDDQKGLLYFQSSQGGNIVVVVNATAAMKQEDEHKILKLLLPLYGVSVLYRSTYSHHQDSLVTCLASDNCESNCGLATLNTAQNDTVSKVHIFSLYPNDVHPCENGVSWFSEIPNTPNVLLLPSCTYNFSQVHETWYLYQLNTRTYRSLEITFQDKPASPICERVLAIL